LSSDVDGVLECLAELIFRDGSLKFIEILFEQLKDLSITPAMASDLQNYMAHVLIYTCQAIYLRVKELMVIL
jgi:hypothetical protein